MRGQAIVRRAGAADLLRSKTAAGISLLLTDPPYDTVDRHSGGHLKRWFRGSLTWSQIARVLATARRQMRVDGLAMVVVNEAGLPHAQAAVRQAGFAHQRLVVWDQRRPGLGTGMRHHVGYVVVGLQPGSRGLRGRDLVAAMAVAPGTKNRYPAEKPIQLGCELAAIAAIRPGDVVVDPFCGSGNLLVGAVERGADVIAGDSSARAVRLATARLKAATAGRRTSLEGRSRKAATALRNSARRPTAKRSVSKAKVSRKSPPPGPRKPGSGGRGTKR